MGKVSKDKRDIYYRKAKEEGWRARSAFKLLHINEKFDIFNGVKKVVDLCAAPGGWSQVLSKQLYHQNTDEPDYPDSSLNKPPESKQVKIVAVDLQPMAPLPGVIQIQGDITKHTTAEEIIRHFEGEKADLVICDGAPDVTGLHCMDVYLQSQLLLGALHIACTVMREGATFVAKIFRSNESDFLLQNQLSILFRSVTITKPRSSRNSSIEAFVVCEHYNPPTGFDPSLIAAYLEDPNVSFENAVGINKVVIPFLVCGDVPFDADANYPLNITKNRDYVLAPPVQQPLEPPYKDALSGAKPLKCLVEFDDYDSTCNPNNELPPKTSVKPTCINEKASYSRDEDKQAKLKICVENFEEIGELRSTKLRDIFVTKIEADKTKYRVPYYQSTVKTETSFISTEKDVAEKQKCTSAEEASSFITEIEEEAKKLLADYKNTLADYKKDSEKYVRNEPFMEEVTDLLHISQNLGTNQVEKTDEQTIETKIEHSDPIYEELHTCVENIKHCCQSEESLVRSLMDFTL